MPSSPYKMPIRRNLKKACWLEQAGQFFSFCLPAIIMYAFHTKCSGAVVIHVLLKRRAAAIVDFLECQQTEKMHPLRYTVSPFLQGWPLLLLLPLSRWLLRHLHLVCFLHKEGKYPVNLELYSCRHLNREEKKQIAGFKSWGLHRLQSL